MSNVKAIDAILMTSELFKIDKATNLIIPSNPTDQAIKQVFVKDWLKLVHKGGDKIRNI